MGTVQIKIRPDAARQLARFILTALFAFYPLSQAAALWIVDCQHPNADDENPGTRELPLLTIKAAAARTVPGDTVLVYPGIYREAVSITNSGEPDKPIVYKSKERHQAVICGSDMITRWDKVAPGVWAAAVKGYKTGMRPEEHGEKGGEWVYIDDAPLQAAVDKDLLLPNSFFFDKPAGRLYVAPPEELNIDTCKVEFSTRQGLFWSTPVVNDIHVIGFTFRHNGGQNQGAWAINPRGLRWRVENNRVAWSSYGGISAARCADGVVAGNIVEWVGNKAVNGNSITRMVFEGNRFLYSNWRLVDPSFAGGASKWVFTSDTIVRKNEFAFNHGSGLWFDIMNTGNLYEGNLCHDNTVWGLFTEISWGETLADNVAYNNGTGITIGESSGCTIKRNICFNNKIGVRMRGNHRRTGGSFDRKRLLEIFNAIPGMAPWRARQIVDQCFLYWFASGAILETNNALWENILFNNTTDYFEFRDYATPSAVDPFVNNYSDNNIFYSAREDQSFAHGTGTYPSFAAWQKASGRDAHSVFADPRDPATTLPEWARDSRDLWDLTFRPISEIDAMDLGMVQSPMSAIAVGRLLRASRVEPLTLDDPLVKGVVYEQDGVRSLALWTSQISARRPVALILEVPAVTVENAYLQKHKRTLVDGRLELMTAFAPVYIHGVPEKIVSGAVTSLSVQGFNLPDTQIPVEILLVNSAPTLRQATVRLQTNPGFAPQRNTIQLAVKAGATARLNTFLVPDGTFPRGRSLVRMEATVGDEEIRRVASFTVGEGGGFIPFLDAPVPPAELPARLKDMGPATLIGTISEESQIAGGDAATWSGPSDAGASLRAAWSSNALWVAVEVTDDVVVSAGKRDPWTADAVELFFDGRSPEMLWQADPTEGVYQVGVSPGDNPEMPSTKVLATSQLAGLETWAPKTETGYTVVLKLPLTAGNFPAGGWKAGRAVKLSILVDDKDTTEEQAARDNVIGWSFSPKGANYKDTSGWKTLVLCTPKAL